MPAHMPSSSRMSITANPTPTTLDAKRRRSARRLRRASGTPLTSAADPPGGRDWLGKPADGERRRAIRWARGGETELAGAVMPAGAVARPSRRRPRVPVHDEARLASDVEAEVHGVGVEADLDDRTVGVELR